MPTVNSAGVEVYYEDYGSGIPIVFAHGAGGNAAIWFEQIAAFSDTYRCVAFDHRTFARSPADPATLSTTQFRDDLLAILDALDIEKAHLVAQSMGGFTCLRLLLDFPERVLSLTMSCTPGGLPNPDPSPAMRELAGAGGSNTSGVIQSMSAATARDPARLQLYQSINAFNTGFSWAYLRGLADPSAAIGLDQLGGVNCPVLFISGAEDPLFPSSLLASYVPHFPDARIEVVENAGHSPYFEQPAQFNRLLAGFLTNGNQR
jgi:3-oxoadipate enol-lactonase